MRLPSSTAKMPCSYGSISAYNSVMTHLLLVPLLQQNALSMRCILLSVLAGANDDYTASAASADQLSSQPSPESGAPVPMRQPVYHTSCHHRKWHRSTIRGEV